MNVSGVRVGYKGRAPATARRPLKLDELPSEILLNIFKHLSPYQLLLYARVCKKWLQLTSDDSLWCKINRKFFPDSSINEHTSKQLQQESWKRKFIKRGKLVRNRLVMKKLHKKYHGPTRTPGIPNNIDKVLRGHLGLKLQMVILNRSGSEYVMPAGMPVPRESQSSQVEISRTLVWTNLEMPSLCHIKCVQLYAILPAIAYEASDKVGKPQMCTLPEPNQKSLIFESQCNWQHLPAPEGSDATIDLHAVHGGLIVGTWKKDKELAFLMVCLHYDQQLVEKCLYGTSRVLYTPKPHEPVPDDIDSQYGLHGYFCTVCLRNHGQEIWREQFRDVFSKEVANGLATFHLYDSGLLQFIGKPIEFSWRTETFNGKIKNVCILDMLLVDEHNTPMWTVSHLVSVQSDDNPKDMDMDYQAAEKCKISYSDSKGKIEMKLRWVKERKQYSIGGIMAHLKTDFINEWFGTKH